MQKKYIFIFVLFLFFFLFGFQFFFGKGMTIGLDATWAPFTGFHSFFSQSVFWHVKDFLLWVFGYQIMSRLYLFTTFLLAVGLAIFAYKKLVGKLDFGVLFPISFILINPFFYERLLTQPGVLIGILLLGYGIVVLLEDVGEFNRMSENEEECLRIEENVRELRGKSNNEDKMIEKDFMKYVLAGIFFGLAFAIMPHSIFMILIVEVGRLLGKGLKRKNIINELKKSLVVLGTVLLVNFNWLVGTFFLGTNHTVQHLQRFNDTNVKVFEVNDLIFSSPDLTTLQLWGFWGEKYFHVLPPYVINSKFYIAGLVILLIVFYGAYLTYKRDRQLFFFLIFIGLSAWILGTGTASKIWGNLIWFLYKYIPFYEGLREPGKWIGVLMIVYMMFMVEVGRKIGSNLKKYFLFYFLLLLARVPTVMFAFHGQLFLTDYPKEYKELKKIIPDNYQKKKYILFPWHSYIACDWTRGKIIANVFDKVFYPIKIIKASNIEMRTNDAYLYSNYENKDKPIESFLKTKNLEILKQNNIGGIIFLKTCADFKNYYWLDNLTGLKKMYSGDKLDVYVITGGNNILDTVNNLINE